MIRDEALIEQINTLWLPVYPYMAAYLLSVSGAREGRMLDLGPFAGGLATSILSKSQAFQATVADESTATLIWAEGLARRCGCIDRLETKMAPLDQIPEADGSFQLIAVRGAFFFLSESLLKEVRRLLAPGGYAWIGGGYGPTTPESVIAPIAERSKTLNEAIGKRRVTANEAQEMVRQAGLEQCAWVVSEGGLWIHMRG